MAETAPSLRTLPFPEQLAAIDAAIDAGRGPELIDRLGGFRDHQPLAHALARLAGRGELAAIAERIAAPVLALPDTGLRRVLRALESATPQPELAAAIAAAAAELPIERIAALAMVDRWLKNAAPAIRRAGVERAVGRCRGAMERGRPEDIGDLDLVGVPGASYAELATAATAAGAAGGWRRRLERFAAVILEALEAQPKSLSQANAEELLARQVYTDPGHFLIELLQNADDAGAARWRVRVAADRVEVEHDGAPFDARDVVGIVSIGQTTKSKEQIGFFGVGFKSVYEICERPQIYSGPFAFEIADVSIPRPLAPRADLAADRTLLILPLRSPEDPERSPRRLFERLAALPGEVLLTLNSIAEIDVAFAAERRRVTAIAEGDSRIRLEEPGTMRRFVVESAEASYRGPRDASRAETTPVLVALELDHRGAPIPLIDRPTIYSYLPTGERSGLRFLVHAHFDVPVDRERLDLSSPWNRWAIAEAAPLLASAVRALAEGAIDPAIAAARLDAVLEVLSLPGELGATAYRSILAELGGVAFLPAADGGRLAANEALLAADPRLARALAGVDFGGCRILRPLDRRGTEIAAVLGARDLEPAAVVAAVAADGAGRRAGDALDPPWAPRFAELAAALADSGADLSPLAGLPCLPDGDGRARCPAELARAGGELRALLAPIRALVAPELEGAANAAFLDRLEVPRATARELVALLADGLRGRRLIQAVGVDRVLAYLAAAPRGELDEAIAARVVPTDRGEIAAIGEAFLGGDSALADVVRAAAVRPALAVRDIEERHGAILAALGAPRLELAGVLACLERGELVLSDDGLRQLHGAIESRRGDISQALATRLARAPIFLATDGSRRTLAGDDPALIPGDGDIATLWPERPWLAPELGDRMYVRGLGVAPVGAATVIAWLRGGPREEEERRRAFAYLAAQAGSLAGDQVAALLAAPLWPGTDGELRPLASLRRPSPHPALAALYDRWPRAATVEPGEGPGTALHLARALGAGERIIEPDLATAIDDIATAGGDIDPSDADLTAAVAAVLEAAASELPRSRLEGAAAAPIFLCDDGVHRPLGRWSEPRSDRAHRVGADLRSIFSGSPFPLLDAGAARASAGFLDAAGVAAATVLDAIRALKGSIDGETTAPLRAALVADRDRLAAAPEEIRAAVTALPLWPAAGEWRAAAEVLRPGALEALLGDAAASWHPILAATGLACLDVASAADAEALADIVAFPDPRRALASGVAAVAIERAPLSEQRPVLASVAAIAPVTAALQNAGEPWSLPLAVDAAGRLVAAPLSLAGDDERAFLAGLPLFDQIADPAWAAAVEERAGPILEPLGARSIVAAIAAASREPAPPAEHASLASAAARAALYRWIMARRGDLAADEPTRGALGGACIFLSAGGVLRRPRDLLFDRDLPDLGIDWSPSDEIAEPLRAWLQATYRPASRQLRALALHMLAAIDEAAGARDVDRLAALVDHLARVLWARGAGDLDEAARRFKLRKRLRVETSDGAIERPRRLLAPGARDADLLARFADPLPPRVADRYRDEITALLLRAAGADAELGDATLAAALDGNGRRPGADAGIALACYVAAAAERRSALRRELDLASRAWVADGRGEPRIAAALYWPEDDARELVGDDPTRFVHPEIVHRVPGAAGWLGARTRDRAALDDVAAHLADRAAAGEPAPEAALVWLEEGLESGRLEAAVVRQAMAALPVLVDDFGVRRPARELVIEGSRRLFGDRRGDWSVGSRLTRLASALRIARRPGKREVAAFLDEVAGVFAGGATLEPGEGLADLVELLPRCLEVLIDAGGRGPALLPIAARQGDGAVLAAVPTAAAELGFPGDGAALEIVVAEGAPLERWRRYLLAYGVGGGGDAGEAAPELPGASARELDEQGDREPPPELDEDGRERERREAEPDGPGLISRLRRWLRGEPDEAEPAERREREPARDRDEGDEPERPPPPSRPPQAPPGGGASRRRSPPPDFSPPPARRDHRKWFRREGHLGPQLAANPEWLADRKRAASFGFGHAPATLPLPHLYAPNAVFAAFDSRRQIWARLAPPPAWSAGGGAGGRLVMSGRVPSGEALVPLPLYGRLVSARGDGVRAIEAGAGPVLLCAEDADATLEIELAAAPDFAGSRVAAASPAALLEPTVEDDELPDEVHDFVASLGGEPDALAAANLVRDFIRDRYVYDPAYLEDPAVAAWLRQRTRRRSNIHVAALHAGGDAECLGRGVCYELNALACELLRRSGIPAAVATGWTFDRGQIDEPDHMWAMALLDAGDGPRWLPVDASSTRDGRPLHAGRRPPGPWRPPRRGARPISRPAWSRAEPGTRRTAEAIPVSDLLRVVRYIERRAELHLGNRDQLLAACHAVLTDPDRAAAVARAILGDED